MRILAIDPGPLESAYVVWDGTTIHEKGKVANKDLAIWLTKYGCQQLKMFGVTPVLWIEMIASYGMPVGAEVFETCVWIGRLMERWSWCHGISRRLKRKEVVVHLCDSAKAKDSNVRQALIDRLGAPGTKANPGVTYGVSKDIWSALAVAVTAYDKMQEKRENFTCP